MHDSILVSVGIPVRNGGNIFRLALDSVLKQTYKNIEIIISNNASTDNTEEICLEAAACDSRIRYFKQDELISSLNNFRFVFEKSHGKYFMWAAHDDLRSENYIETLIQGFIEYPNASIVFSKAKFFDDTSLIKDEEGRICNLDLNIVKPTPETPKTFKMSNKYSGSFDSRSTSFFEKHAHQARSLCLHIYGLINPKYLEDYQWFDIRFAPDVPLLHWLLCFGDFILVEEECFFFYYIGSLIPKETSTYSKLTIGSYHVIRHSWMCAKSIVYACNLQPKSIQGAYLLLTSFMVIYLSRHGGFMNLIFKGVIYSNLPLPIKSVWRKSKVFFSGPKPHVI